MLLVFSGLPGTGKSTLAHEVAQRLGAVYLRADTIEATLLNAGHTGITVEGYATAYALAADNLALGLSVVADNVNPVAQTREAWAEVARHSGARLVNVEVICSDVAEHRRRVQSRHADAEAHAGKWSPPDWKAAQGWEYQPWPEQLGQEAVLRMDTAQGEVAELTQQLLNLIQIS